MTAAVTTDIEAVIGLEVHAQLLTQSKMFCGCSAAYLAGAPNSHTCPVCLGLPGALPFANQKAIEYTIRTALALNCEIPEHSKFDRKNYFYPDLPKGYQISQYDLPLSKNGHLDIDVEGQVSRVGITRVHLEEDTGKLIHAGDIHTSTSSLVNLNRCGVPLMEIVSEPDMRTPAQAREYMQRLRQVLVWIGVNDGNLEEGSLRCDANVSVRPRGQKELGVKVEVKNMNSFRAVFMALEHEIQRQSAALANGEEILQETRGWNEGRGVTVGQRSKEYAHDYRYFPEPDLPPLTITRETVDRIRAELPELPAQRAKRFSETLGLSAYDAAQLSADRNLADYFEEVVAGVGTTHAKEAANWVIGDVNRVLKEGEGIAALNVRPGGLAALVLRKLDGTISNNQARDLFAVLVGSGAPVADTTAIDHEIEARGMRQVTDDSQLEAWVDKAIAAQPQAAEDFRGGNDRAVGRLVGAVMQASGGKASGPAVSAMLTRKLRG
ncbi:MAG: aspartyl-tRNA(Asn)/glutamyl-tRNA(Gln) amidotransferase subunit [Chloroflexota bacterium]|jgi:aspartyl-tRNA(Asn)/glutamyl-tRNA(Gln) amidotransferase subunit B|nr:aspartyl-tRNA(Asn)/glutamyl-tRNA(Gln) amidotransferase subunit [Chloroflexota bacterium]